MLQKLIDHIYRYPKAKYLAINRFGGLFSYIKISKGKRNMMKNSYNLLPLTSSSNGYALYFLTGKKYLYQTIFCIKSLLTVSSEKFKIHLVDDGSFTSLDLTFIKNKLPCAIIICRNDIEERLLEILPFEKFPYLHHKRKVYPHIKKLIDVHIFKENDWKLVLDSDMLFWKEPKEIIDWLKNPTKPLYMKDCEQSYGFDISDMEALCNHRIPDKLNVGIIGLKSSRIPWNDLELWAKSLEVNYASYYLEQALTAMIVAEQGGQCLKSADYIVNPSQNEIENQVGILHHYVDLSKKGYFEVAWKNLLNR